MRMDNKQGMIITPIALSLAVPYKVVVSRNRFALPKTTTLYASKSKGNDNKKGKVIFD